MGDANMTDFHFFLPKLQQNRIAMGETEDEARRSLLEHIGEDAKDAELVHAVNDPWLYHGFPPLPPKARSKQGEETDVSKTGSLPDPSAFYIR